MVEEITKGQSARIGFPATEYKVLDFAIKMGDEAPGLAVMTAALNEAARENWAPTNQGQVISVYDGMRYVTVILTRQVYK